MGRHRKSKGDKQRQMCRKPRRRARDQAMPKCLNPAKRCQLATARGKIGYMLGYMLGQAPVTDLAVFALGCSKRRGVSKT